MAVRGRHRGLRVGRRAFCLAALGVLLFGMVKLYGPVASNRRQQDELAHLRLEKASLVAEGERLEAYKRHLASDAGIEAAVRREGYVRDGERRLVFVRQKRTKASAEPVPSEEPPAR